MKRFGELTCRFLSTMLFTLMLCFGTAYTLVTGFSLEVSPYRLLTVSLVISAVTAVPYLFKKKWIPNVVLMLLAAAAFIKFFPRIEASALSVVKTIVDIYQKTYPKMAELVAALAEVEPADPIWVLASVMTLLAFIGAACENREIYPICVGLVALPFIAVCLIALDTIPEPLPLVIIGAAFVFLVFSNAPLFREGTREGTKLLLILPVALFVCLTAYFTKPDTYEKSDVISEVQEVFSRITSRLPGPGAMFSRDTLGIEPWNENPDTIDLTVVGSRRISDEKVMEVTTDKAGTIYLKGTVFSDYDGKNWKASLPSYEKYMPGEEVWTNPAGNVTQRISILTEKRAGIYYYADTLTEFPSRYFIYSDLYLKNPGYSRRYDLKITDQHLSYPGTLSRDYAEYVIDTCLALPEETVQKLYNLLLIQGGYSSYFTSSSLIELSEYAAKDPELFQNITDMMAMRSFYSANLLKYQEALDPLILLQDKNVDIPPESSVFYPAYKTADILSTVKKYLSALGDYYLDPPMMPEDEDFVVWFLKDQKDGYCIHFASAATVLLRYLGVPARLAVGYAFSASDKETTKVTQERAHAWVEYFDGATLSWQIFDPTPGTGEGSAQQQTEFDPTAEIEHPVTRPVELPTELPTETSTEPTTEEPTEPEPPHSVRNTLPSWVRILLIAVGAIALCVGLWFASRALLQRYLDDASCRESDLRYYRRLKKFDERTEYHLPEEADALGLKARFSKDGLSEEERKALKSCYYKACSMIKHWPPKIKGFWYRIIYFL